MTIPEEFVIQKFYQHAGYPRYTKSTNTYTGGCPICREGNSWGRKSRLYYIPNDEVICCHNCGWYSSHINWIMEVDKISYKELMQQVERCDYEYGIPRESNIKDKPTVDDLPKDSINILNSTQLNYYKDNKVIKDIVSMIVDRRLNVATNKPRSLFVSLTDYTHKNRLIIPFYNHKNECVFYQSRRIYDDGTPKYLSKSNGDKTLFNYNNIQSGADNVFITEGPIDSFFIDNCVAVAGIQQKSKNSLTIQQVEQFDRLFLTQRVWVLDSQWLDQTSRLKTEELLTAGQCVFLWPSDVGTRFKDINEMCIHFKINKVSEKYILDNTYCGLKGIVKLKQIK